MNWILFLFVIASLETGGARDPDRVRGRHGERGRYQITRVFLAQSNRAAGTRYTLDQMENPTIGAAVVIAWHTQTGTQGGVVGMARRHNGGPTGDVEPWTLDYGTRAGNLFEALAQERAADADLVTVQDAAHSMSQDAARSLDVGAGT
jgi:hypothetical protein